MNNLEIIDYDRIELLILEKLKSEKSKLIHQWNNPNGTKTKHFILDNLLPDDLTLNIYNNFPDTKSDLWHEVDTFRERKRSFAKIDTLGPIIKNVTDVFHSQKIISLIGEICSMNLLEPDPSLYAGGISLMKFGDFLNPHIDNSHDKNRSRYRRLNLLFYVTPEWSSSDGGNFELWDENVHNSLEIVSKFSRLVVMETNKFSWHSVNKVESNLPRCCVSNYYFSSETPVGEKNDYYHVTSFNGRPKQKLIRIYCKIDNTLRSFIAKKLNVNRGKSLIRKI